MNVRTLVHDDIGPIAEAFARLGWNKPVSQYERYLEEQEGGTRVVLVAHLPTGFAGYETIVWSSEYEPFRESNTPEIVDLNVLPPFRRRGIASRLLDAAESLIAEHAAQAGIGVGMSPDYGPAQRLYVQRGYVPDGRGLTSNGRIVSHGDEVTVDDNLVLHLTKSLVRSFGPSR